jgi:hypothetical protein
MSFLPRSATTAPRPPPTHRLSLPAPVPRPIQPGDRLGSESRVAQDDAPLRPRTSELGHGVEVVNPEKR